MLLKQARQKFEFFWGTCVVLSVNTVVSFLEQLPDLHMANCAGTGCICCAAASKKQIVQGVANAG
jgi:hypothetical protein